MRPNPSTPSTLSASSTPPHFERSHRPAVSAAWACGMLRASARSRPIVCSAAETMFDSGAFATTIPRRVAASTSTLSTPTPARPTTFSRVARSITSAVTFVAERTIRPSYWSMISSSGESVSTSTSKCSRSRSIPASAIRSRTRTFTHAVTGVSNASNARGTATPRSISAPSSISESSTAASAVAMSKTSNQPMCPIRKIFPFRCCWPGASVTPCRSRRWSSSSSLSIPSGARIAVTTAAVSSSGEKSSRPIAFTPARAARPRRMCRSNPLRACRRGSGRARRPGCGSARRRA